MHNNCDTETKDLVIVCKIFGLNHIQYLVTLNSNGHFLEVVKNW